MFPSSVQVAAFAAVFFNVCDTETKFACPPKSLFFKEDLQLREMVCKLVHFSNTAYPMLVTLSGIVMPVKLLHSENVYSPMLVTLSGIVMLVKLVQL